MPRKSKAATAAGENNDGQAGLTDSELRFLKAVFDNMTQKPDANWDNVAASLGLKDSKCAKERFRQMSVRHGWQNAGNSSPRKAGKCSDATGPSGDGKITKKPRTPAKKVKQEGQNVEDEVDTNESEV